MSSEAQMLQCYNRSCGQTFVPEKNTSESCTHHPGFPVFHDVYKKWSCCEKKTTDFTEFLNIKGCAKSYHSNIKPQDPPKPNNQVTADEIEPIRPPLQKEVYIRPCADQPLIPLRTTIGSSLKPILENLQKEKVHQVDTENDQTIKIDTTCKNKGCRVLYKGEHTNLETCLFHSGFPIFHEGMKYWSCCVKKTSDFNSFLEQIGCSTGQHKWHEDVEVTEKANCRYDWHQTGNYVVISIYSKCPLPELSLIEANPVKLKIHLSFGEKRSVFDEELVLFGAVNVQESLVTYLGSKVEIKLKKDGPALCWKNLTLQQQNNSGDSMPGVESIKIQDK